MATPFIAVTTHVETLAEAVKTIHSERYETRAAESEGAAAAARSPAELRSRPGPRGRDARLPRARLRGGDAVGAPGGHGRPLAAEPVRGVRLQVNALQGG